MTRMEPCEVVVECKKRRVTNANESFVIVEGKTDRALWSEYRDNDKCFVFPIEDRVNRNNKAKIVNALEDSLRADMCGIAGIVDGDYWLITQANELNTENLLFDVRWPDMESILLNSAALRKVLRHSVDTDDIDRLHAFADKLRAESQRLAAEFGYFRVLSLLKEYRLQCNRIRLKQVICLSALELDSEWIARRLAEDLSDMTGEQLLCEVSELRTQYTPDNTQLCRGKDVIDIMVHILPTLFESEYGETLSNEAKSSFHARGLARDLRMAYEYGYFLRTSLYSCIRNWESANSPYKILKPEI